MSSAPLLEKPRSSKSAPQRGKKTRDANLSCFLGAADLGSAIGSVRQISPWTVWKSESDHVTMVSELDYVINVIERASSQLANAQNEPRQVDTLSRLETTLTASQGVPAKCLLMLADEIEKVFLAGDGRSQGVSTASDVQEFLDGYVSWVDETQFEGITIRQWAAIQQYPYDPSYVKDIDTFHAKLGEFKAWIAKQSIQRRNEFYTKYPEGTPTMIEWLRKGLGRLISNGHYEINEPLYWELKTSKFQVSLEKKAALKWSAFGSAVCGAMQACNLPEHTFSSTPHHRGCLRDIRDVVMPQFQFQLYQLKGVLEGQIKTVDSLKAKILAGIVSAALAGGQLAATYVTHMLQHEQ